MTRTPEKPLPMAIVRWGRRLTLLRWLDAALAWLTVWVTVMVALPGAALDASALVALVVVVAGVIVPPLRDSWRPASGAVGLAISSGLRPGDLAWYVDANGSTRVLVTGRRGIRLVVAQGNRDAHEGHSVRRTRALLIPASDA
jgi:hypothetical protein